MQASVFVCKTSTATSNSQLSLLLPSDASCLLVCPSTDRFNDFGTVSRVEVFVARASKGIVATLSGKLLLANKQAGVVVKNTSDVFRKLFENAKDPILLLDKALEGYRYVSALINSDDYKKLIDEVGAIETRILLGQLHDVGVLLELEEQGGDLTWFQSKAEYANALLRSDATFLAVYDLQDLLKLTTKPDVRPTAIKVTAEFLSRGEIEFRFVADALGVNRINVLVGVNGVGKSRLLRELSISAGVTGPVLFVPSPLDDVETLQKPAQLRIREHPATASGWAYMTRALALIMRDPDRSLYRNLRRAVSSFLDLDNIALPLVNDDRSEGFATYEAGGRRFRHIRNASSAGEGRRTEFYGLVDYLRPPIFVVEDQIRNLSSGERALLGLATILVREIPLNGLVLLDEPELSLHPKMIADLIRLLGLLLEARGAHCIVATHSLFVVRETPDTAVHVLKRTVLDGIGISDFEPMIQTLGAGLTELSNVIFDDWNIRDYFEQRIEEYLDKTRTEEEISKVRSQLGEAARAAMLDLTLGQNR